MLPRSHRAHARAPFSSTRGGHGETERVPGITRHARVGGILRARDRLAVLVLTIAVFPLVAVGDTAGAGRCRPFPGVALSALPTVSCLEVVMAGVAVLAGALLVVIVPS